MSQYTERDLSRVMIPVTCLNIQAKIKAMLSGQVYALIYRPGYSQDYDVNYMPEHTRRDLGQLIWPVTCLNIEDMILAWL